MILEEACDTAFGGAVVYDASTTQLRGTRDDDGLEERADAAVQEARLAWLALTLTPGMGPTRCARAVQQAGRCGAFVSCEPDGA